jgi:Ca2+-binding EF-hand superfamily protein
MAESDNEVEQVLTTEEREQQEAEERNQIWQCFMQFDHEQEGVISTQDLKQALEHLNERVTDTQVFRMISQVDPTNAGVINFHQFKELVMQKREDEKGSSDQELLEAFVAMGGEADGGGCVDADKLIETIKKEFEMTIDIVALINEVDEDGSGEIEFDEFKELLAGGPTAEGGDDDDDGDD